MDEVPTEFIFFKFCKNFILIWNKSVFFFKFIFKLFFIIKAYYQMGSFQDEFLDKALPGNKAILQIMRKLKNQYRVDDLPHSGRVCTNGKMWRDTKWSEQCTFHLVLMSCWMCRAVAHKHILWNAGVRIPIQDFNATLIEGSRWSTEFPILQLDATLYAEHVHSVWFCLPSWRLP